MKSRNSIPGQMTIEDAVCQEWGVTHEQLLSPSRKYHLPDARKVIIYYYRIYRKTSLAHAALMVNRDHATASDAVRVFISLWSYDAAFREKATRVLKNVVPGDISISPVHHTKTAQWSLSKVDNDIILTTGDPAASIFMNVGQARKLAGEINLLVNKIQQRNNYGETSKVRPV